VSGWQHGCQRFRREGPPGKPGRPGAAQLEWPAERGVDLALLQRAQRRGQAVPHAELERGAQLAVRQRRQ
jgi:hypothetical protein